MESSKWQNKDGNRVWWGCRGERTATRTTGPQSSLSGGTITCQEMVIMPHSYPLYNAFAILVSHASESKLKEALFTLWEAVWSIGWSKSLESWEPGIEYQVMFCWSCNWKEDHSPRWALSSRWDWHLLDTITGCIHYSLTCFLFSLRYGRKKNWRWFQCVLI